MDEEPGTAEGGVDASGDPGAAPEGPGEAEDRLKLARSGKYLMAAGFLSALVAGAYGLNANDLVVVFLAVGTALGYAVAGWLLVGAGEAGLEPAAAVAVVASLFTFWLLGGPVAAFAGGFGQFVLFPLITLLLAFAGGGVLSAALARTVEMEPAEVRGRDTAAFLLHGAAAPPIWGAFLITNVAELGISPFGAAFAIGAAGFAAIVAATGGRLVAAGCHPRYALAAAILVLGANAWYLVEFSVVVAEFGTGAGGPGRALALVGVLTAVFPVAFSAVAWYQMDLLPAREAGRSGS